MQNFCGKCGAKLSGSNEFCTNCGAKILDDKESTKEEIKKEEKFETKTQQESKKKYILKIPPKAPTYISKNQSIDLNIKRISILIIGLFISLMITEAIVVAPIRIALDFKEYENDFEKTSREYDRYSIMHNEAKKLSQDEDNKSFYKKVQLDRFKNEVQQNYPYFYFGGLFRSSLLILLMIILTYAAKELIKDQTKLKWAIVFAILLIGIFFAILVTVFTEKEFEDMKFLFYLLLTISISFNFIAFYNSKKIGYWILTPSIIAIVFLIFFNFYDFRWVNDYYEYPLLSFESFNLKLAYYARTQLSTLLYYSLLYLAFAFYFVLPSVTIYLFLKEFVFTREN